MIPSGGAAEVEALRESRRVGEDAFLALEARRNTMILDLRTRKIRFAGVAADARGRYEKR
jgi:hypothetical protein